MRLTLKDVPVEWMWGKGEKKRLCLVCVSTCVAFKEGLCLAIECAQEMSEAISLCDREGCAGRRSGEQPGRLCRLIPLPKTSSC